MCLLESARTEWASQAVTEKQEATEEQTPLKTLYKCVLVKEQITTIGVYVHVSVCVCVNVYVYLYVSVSIFMCEYLWMCVNVCTYESECEYICIL